MIQDGSGGQSWEHKGDLLVEGPQESRGTRDWQVRIDAWGQPRRPGGREVGISQAGREPILFDAERTF